MKRFNDSIAACCEILTPNMFCRGLFSSSSTRAVTNAKGSGGTTRPCSVVPPATARYARYSGALYPGFVA